jgi:hypothetical protein
MRSGILLDSKILLVGNMYRNVRANNEVKPHRLPGQALTFGVLRTTNARLLRFWDSVVPISGRASQLVSFRPAVAAKLPRLCRCVGSSVPAILRGLRQFDGSAADQFRSRRALS